MATYVATPILWYCNKERNCTLASKLGIRSVHIHTHMYEDYYKEKCSRLNNLCSIKLFIHHNNYFEQNSYIQQTLQAIASITILIY